MRNADVARILDEIADIREIQGANTFRVRAYRLAGETVRGLGQPLRSLRRIQPIAELPHVGKAIAAKIEELLDTGLCREHDDLLASREGGLVEVVQLPGIGPKRARAISETLNVGSIADLERAAASGALSQVPGLGTKTQARILRALGRRRAEGGHILLGDALERAEALCRELSELPHVQRTEVAGGVRRGLETVEAIDLVASSSRPAETVERFVERHEAGQVISHADARARVRRGDGTIVDLRAAVPGSFGSVWHQATGPDEHARQVQFRAQQRLADLQGDRLVADRTAPLEAATEEQVYAAAGLPPIPPELREREGVLELAAAGDLPELVELEDVRGDCQMHTTSSDGRADLAAMVAAAMQRGYDYGAVTDHSSRMPGGLDARRLARQWAEVEKFNSRPGTFRLLRGVEVDILEDGRLDLDDACLADADLVVAAVHSRMDQEREAMTVRILRALDNRHVHVLAHPTGRRLQRREPYALSLERIFVAARDRGVLLECNAHPQRLDLSAENLRRAVDVGVGVVISTDAHDVAGLGHMRLGVATARRAGLTARHVANTRKTEEFLALIGSR